MRFALHGDEAVVDHRFEKIKRAFAHIDGAEVWGTKCAPEDIPSLEHPSERVQGGVPSLDLERHDRLVRRRGGRPHRLLPDRPDGRPRRPRACATCCAAMVNDAGLDYIAGAAADQRAQLCPHHDGDLRHQEPGPGAQRLRRLARGWSARPPSSATASTARISASWISPPSSTRGATTPTAASARRSRTRSTQTASSRPASRASGRARCAATARGLGAVRAVSIAEDRRLVAREHARPSPATGQALLEVAFCGICGSDLHFRDVPELFPVGTIPGHEMWGRIVALGDGLPAWQLGDRVTVLPFAQCGECELCLSGQEQVCPQAIAERRRARHRAPGRLRRAGDRRRPHAVRAAGLGR